MQNAADGEIGGGYGSDGEELHVLRDEDLQEAGSEGGSGDEWMNPSGGD